MKKFLLKNKLLILILLISLFLRIYKLPSYMEFLGDQGRDLLTVRRFLKKADLMFIGPQTSIGGMYLGPWYYYLIAPALLLFNFSPVGPAFLMSLFGVLTVFLVYKFSLEWFNKTTAVIAGLLTAFSPVLIKYSTFSWNPNIMPVFSLLSIWLIYRIWQKKEFKKMVWLGICLAMILNSHYLGLLLFPVIGLFWLLVCRGRVFRPNGENTSLLRYSVYGILIFFLFILPLFLFDLKHDWMNTRAFWKFFTVRQTTVNIKVYKGFNRVPQLVSQIFSQLLINKDKFKHAWFLIFVFLFGLWKMRRKPVFRLIFSLILITFLGLASYKQHVYAHYLLFFIPFLIMIIAYGLSRLRVWGIGFGVVILIIMFINWHGWQEPVYQLRRAKNVADFIKKQADDEKFAIALLAEQNYDPPYRYFLENTKLINLHEQMSEQLFVICEPWGKINCNPIGHEKWQIAAFGWAKKAEEWDLESVKIYKLVHNKDEGN